MDTTNENLGPAARYTHNHPQVRNPWEDAAQQMTLGQRVADHVAAAVGSWPFIIIQTLLLGLWIIANVYCAFMENLHPGFLKAWDPYPFILLNLVLSFQAAYTGPVVMMSQNRQSDVDRLMARHDFEINCKSEREIQVVMEHLAHQDQLLLEAIRRVEALHAAPSPALTEFEELLRRMERNDERIIALMERMEGSGGVEGSAGNARVSG